MHGDFLEPLPHTPLFSYTQRMRFLCSRAGPPNGAAPSTNTTHPRFAAHACARGGGASALVRSPPSHGKHHFWVRAAPRDKGGVARRFARTCVPPPTSPPLLLHTSTCACAHASTHTLAPSRAFTWHEREIFATFFSAPQNLCAHTRPVLPVPLPPPCSFLFLLPHACGAVLPRAFVARRAFAHTRALLSSAGKLPPVKCTHAVAARGERARNARARGVEIELDAHTTRRSVCVCVGLGPLLFFSQRHVCFGVAVVLSPAVWPSLALLRLCKKRVY